MGIGFSIAAAAASKVLESSSTYHRQYNFYVEFDGLPTAFSKVSGMTKTTSFDSYQEGGLNNGALSLRGPMEGGNVVRFEYGCCIGTMSRDTFVPGSRLKTDIVVMAFGNNILTVPRTYILEDCYIKSVSVGDLDASTSGIILNSIEVIYRRMSIPGENI